MRIYFHRQTFFDVPPKKQHENYPLVIPHTLAWSPKTILANPRKMAHPVWGLFCIGFLAVCVEWLYENEHPPKKSTELITEGDGAHSFPLPILMFRVISGPSDSLEVHYSVLCFGVCSKVDDCISISSTPTI